ncbi:hypothetical protein V1277_001135 [Bradyrhizobium sp. AZCC 1588]|uniref:hypothetical protein n=1 Tax=unclassified Bradyrhizobium TaxID=2631580 RepID=UPI002FF06422
MADFTQQLTCAGIDLEAVHGRQYRALMTEAERYGEARAVKLRHQGNSRESERKTETVGLAAYRRVAAQETLRRSSA